MRIYLYVLVVGFSTLMCSHARANLNSFAPADGYNLAAGTILGDVTYYNAGQYGPNAGNGPGPTQIPADSGLWQLVSPVGGYFATAANRNAAVGAGPPYAPNPANTVAAYIVGNHSPGRNGDGNSLALRNDTSSGTGPMIYDYNLDSYDFNGVNPASVVAGPVTMQFYFCPNPGDTPNPGSKPGDKFTMSLMDTSGNVGVEWGYDRANGVTWRTSNANVWNATAIIADQANWDGMRIDLDLTTDTFSFDYYDISTNTWSNLAPAGTPMGQAMNDFTRIRWQLEDGLSAGVGGKNFFDDFSFTIPEPSAALLIAVGGLAMLSRKTSLSKRR